MKFAKLEQLIRALFLIGAFAGGASVMTACTDDGPFDDGPFEEAGEEIEDVVDDIGDEIEDQL